MLPSAAQVGAQSPQPLARRMMDEAGLQVISLAAQAGAAALPIASSPAAASAARPGPWVWTVSVIIAPLNGSAEAGMSGMETSERDGYSPVWLIPLVPAVLQVVPEHVG